MLLRPGFEFATSRLSDRRTPVISTTSFRSERRLGELAGEGEGLGVCVWVGRGMRREKVFTEVRGLISQGRVPVYYGYCILPERRSCKLDILVALQITIKVGFGIFWPALFPYNKHKMVNFHLHFVDVYYTIKIIMSCCKKQWAYSHSHWCIYLIFLYFDFDIRLRTRTLPELSKNGPQVERGYQSPFPPDRPRLRSGSDLITLLLPKKIKCYTFSEVRLGLRPVR